MTDLSRTHGFASQALGLRDGRFFRPPLPDGHVPRLRLCQRLQAGLGGRLLLVNAPAGFGKSSLAIEFCEALPEHWRSLWLGLSQRDADPGRFLERLLEGLQQYCPALGGQAMGLLKMRQRHQPFAFEEWLDGLLDELALYLQADTPLLLVLDDYHLAQGPVLDRCLQFFLNHLPPGLVLLVTSRQRPDWHLARLRLSRQLVELNEQDLRLTADESLAVIGRQPTGLRGQALDNLIQRSDGWVAGLRFWQLAASDSADEQALPQALHGGEGLIRDYLLEEVIDRLPADVQAFLDETACQERFCAPLCDAMRGRHDSAAVLSFLQAHQVFLVPLDEHGHWFRYHHLFSDLLRSRQASESQVALHLRACRWFEAIVLYSWALGLACQLDAAEELAGYLSRILPAPSATAQKSMLAQWLALSGVIARGRGDRERTLAYCGEALQSLPSKRYGQRLVCLSTLSNLAIADGDFWRARGWNREALELAQRVGNPLFEALAHYDRARVLHARGEVLRALDEVRQGLQRLQGLSAQRLYAVRARLTLYEGYLLVSRLQPAQGRARLRAGLGEARACRDISVLIGHCVIATLDGREGHFAEAFAELAEAERLMHIWDVPPVYYLAMITLVKCELWLAQGRTDLAESWLQRLGQTYGGEQPAAAPEFHPLLPLHIALQQAALDRIQLRSDDAVQRLACLVKRGQDSGGMMLAVSALSQWLSLLLDEGKEGQAAQLLPSLLEAAHGGVMQPMQPLLEKHPQWLHEQLQAGAACPVQAELLKHLPPVSIASTGNGEALSGREMAVLELIAQGCSNQQISERLFISLHTVKTHASHINSKLGVERRTQAVAKAKSLGLLA